MRQTMSKVYQVRQWREGQVLPEDQGIFTTKELAVAACKTRMHFIEPFDLDVELPEENIGENPEAWFPLAIQPSLGEQDD